MSRLNNSKNIFWINAVKALCILAVYFVHCEIYYGVSFQTLNDIIHPVYVNGFFFVSGYLLFRKQLSSPLIDQPFSSFITTSGGGNIIYRLVIPSILFALVEYFPKKIIRGEAINIHSLLSNTIGGGTYWFTSALIVAETIIILLLITRKKSIWYYVIMGLLVAYGGLYLVHIDYHLFGFGRDPWAYRRGLLAVAFLVAGGVYWRYESIIHKWLKNYILILLFVIYCVSFFFFSKYIRVLISTMDINVIGYFTSLLGCVILVESCKRLRYIKALNFIGSYSLCYYFLSGALPMLSSLFVKRLLPTNNVVIFITIFFVCIIISTVITYVLNRFIPFVFDIRKLFK